MIVRYFSPAFASGIIVPVSVPVTWIVAVDFNDDGDFSDANEDVSVYIERIRWRVGFEDARSRTAAANVAEVQLANFSFALWPEVSSLAFDRGRLIRIQSYDGVTTVTHFVGFIRDFWVDAGDVLRVGLRADSSLSFAERSKVVLSPQIQKRSDEIVAALLAGVQARRGILSPRWILGLAGYSELGVTTYLGAAPYASAVLSTDCETWPYVGEGWAAGVEVSEGLRQVVDAECGRLWEDRSGVVRLLSRAGLILASVAASVATFDKSARGVRYEFGADAVSVVRVQFRPRAVSVPKSIVWQLGSVQRLPSATRDSDKQILALFRDGAGELQGAFDVQGLQPGSDYTANASSDGSGADRTSSVSFDLASLEFGAARLRVLNSHSSSVYLTSAQLRGTGVYRGDPVIVEKRFPYAETFYGRLEEQRVNDVVDSFEAAERMAATFLGRRHVPSSVVSRVVVSSDVAADDIRKRAVMDVVTLQDARFGLDGKYLILGEQHEVIPRRSHLCTWVVESVTISQVWILGVDRLSVTTYLG